MDRRSTVVLIACAGLFALWVLLTPKVVPPPQRPSRTNAVASATNLAQPLTNAAAPSLAATNQIVSVMPPPGAPEETLTVTNGLARFHFTSHGGGLKLVELDPTRYPESVASFAGKPASQRPASLNRHSPQPVLALLNAEAIQGDGAYKLSRTTRMIPPPTNAPASPPRAAEVVRAEKLLANQVYLVKEFEPAPDFLLHAWVRIENRSTQALALPPLEWSVGSATPENPQDKGAAVGFGWHNGNRMTKVEKLWFENRSLGCLPGTPHSEYRATNATVTWVALFNQFFFMALKAEEPSSEVFGTRFDLPQPAREELAADRLTLTNQTGFRVSLTQPATNLAAGAALERGFIFYAGPKEMRVVERIAPKFGGDLDSYMLYPGVWSLFEVFSRVLLLSMSGLHSLGVSYALAIVLITVLLKLLFWPLTQASTRSMKRMQALGPQMKAMQEKYKDDPQKLQKKMWEFYREHKVNPMSGCLPMLVQVPVFIGFFTMVRSAIELRGAAFLWATDLSKPDTIAVLPWFDSLPFWPFTWLHNFPINPLSLIMGVTMLFQARMAPPAPGMDPTAQKMMRYMPLFFLVILYNYSAGLTLYWTVQNLLTIVQTKLTKAKGEPAKNPARPSNPARPATPAPALRRRK